VQKARTVEMVLISGGFPRPMAAASLLATVIAVFGGVHLFRQLKVTGTVTQILTHRFAVGQTGEDRCHASAGAATQCGPGFQAVDDATCCPSALSDVSEYYSSACGSSCASGFLTISGPAEIAAEVAGACDHFCYKPDSSFWLNDCAGCPAGHLRARKITFPGGMGPHFPADRPACWNLCTLTGEYSMLTAGQASRGLPFIVRVEGTLDITNLKNNHLIFRNGQYVPNV